VVVELHKNWTVREGDFLRVANAYYQIESARYYNKVSHNVTLTLKEAYASTSGTYSDAEIGYFYSDPDAVSGVSTFCLANRITRSSTISVDSSASTLSAEIRAIDTVQSDASALTVARYRHSVNSTKVGYYWDVTFNNQPGDLKPMTCVGDGYYYKTNAFDGEKFCNITTMQDGSLVDGYFQLGTTYPHEYVNYPVQYNSTYLRRDIEADLLASLLESVVVDCNKHGSSSSPYYWDECSSYEQDDVFKKVWGDLTIERNSYTPSADTRWSGGYAWTITFTSRPGNVPQMSSSTYVTNPASTSRPNDYDLIFPPLNVEFEAQQITKSSQVEPTLQVADERGSSGVDMYQGVDNYFEFSVDEPTVSATDGNQIIGTFGLNYGGVSSSQTAFSVQAQNASLNSFEAMSAKKIQKDIPERAL
jgi:hypothetical protein